MEQQTVADHYQVKSKTIWAMWKLMWSSWSRISRRFLKASVKISKIWKLLLIVRLTLSWKVTTRSLKISWFNHCLLLIYMQLTFCQEKGIKGGPGVYIRRQFTGWYPTDRCGLRGVHPRYCRRGTEILHLRAENEGNAVPGAGSCPGLHEDHRWQGRPSNLSKSDGVHRRGSRTIPSNHGWYPYLNTYILTPFRLNVLCVPRNSFLRKQKLNVFAIGWLLHLFGKTWHGDSFVWEVQRQLQAAWGRLPGSHGQGLQAWPSILCYGD